MCGNKPAAGVKVKLWDEDDGKAIILSPVQKILACKGIYYRTGS